MKIALHQPNLFPWYPYFHKMKQADKFVILIRCQFENEAFQKRFHLNNKWYTMPIRNRKKLEPIMNKQYADSLANWETLKRKLPEYAGTLSFFDDDIGLSLSATNIRIIKKIRAMLGIETELVYDYPTGLTSTERVIDLIKHFGGDTFIAGPSAGNYGDIELYANAGIKVEPHQINEDLKVPILPMLQKVLG